MKNSTIKVGSVLTGTYSDMYSWSLEQSRDDSRFMSLISMWILSFSSGAEMIQRQRVLTGYWLGKPGDSNHWLSLVAWRLEAPQGSGEEPQIYLLTWVHNTNTTRRNKIFWYSIIIFKFSSLSLEYYFACVGKEVSKKRFQIKLDDIIILEK